MRGCGCNQGCGVDGRCLILIVCCKTLEMTNKTYHSTKPKEKAKAWQSWWCCSQQSSLSSPSSPPLSPTSMAPSSPKSRQFTSSGLDRGSLSYKRKVCHPKGALHVVAASGTKKTLIMGGTRFIGVFLSRLLVKEGHQVTLFTRGKAPVTQQLPGESDSDYSDFKSEILHLKGDRQDFEFVKSSLSAEGYDVVYDINGREAAEVEPILDALPNLEQFIYCSSAGVYLKSDILPHCEVDAVDPKSRHKGKLNTESLLEARGVNWTSLRPVYIYGPLNYNPVEEWFFHRLKAGRPIPIPNSGVQITQLGHVKDLATAFVQVLGNEKASKQVFNISGEKYVTFDGLAKACAKAGGFPEPEIIHYNPKEFDFGKKKAFPFRDQHFFASVEKAKHVLGWKPEFDLVEGLADSYNLDFGRGTYRKEADFTTDDMILNKSFALQS
ncbi:Chloroplast stem-loop binding protein of 41 kDa b [Hibiscus syriacus]|uniref:Chloroplast stem-loop binding protein of 41 kDa b n=1 Tax=Hibiscus syriacus TaxID=106335 RepID=A0A6A2XV83_HIBSY|nr:Chloroplast stem-loop binding protein of 41 kDa b [Hibiscus syriacus]